MKESMWRRVSVGDKTIVSERVSDNERSGKEILQRKNTSITEEKERVNREREREREKEKQREEEKERETEMVRNKEEKGRKDNEKVVRKQI